jgi:hypothetical protein
MIQNPKNTMLKKGHKLRRESFPQRALQILLDIIQHTDYITVDNWQKIEVSDPIKKSLCDFVDFVRNRRIIGWLGKLNEFGFIQEYCKDKRSLDIKSLQDYLNTIKDSLISRMETIDDENEYY